MDSSRDTIDVVNEDSLDQEFNVNNFNQVESDNSNEMNEGLFKIVANISSFKANQHLNMMNMGLLEIIKRYL